MKIKVQSKIIKLFTLYLFLLTLIITLHSCAVSGISNKTMTFNPTESNNGLIFGSITFPIEKARFNSYFLQISYKSTDAKAVRKNYKEIQFSPEQIIKMKHKGEMDDGQTYLFAIERPEGDYEILGIKLFRNSGIAIMQRNDYIGGFSIPFKVNKGEILYVGNILFDEYAGANYRAVKYTNNFEKDLISIKRVQPNAYWDGAKNDTLIKIYYKKEL